MTKLYAAAAAIALMASPALAERLSASAGGHFSGSATSFAASAGGSFGNGSSASEAGQFAGSMSSLSGGLNEARNGISVTATTESFTEGFDKSWTTGSSLAGALRGGAAWGTANYWGEGSGEW